MGIREYIVGIDPGFDGAIAAVDAQGRLQRFVCMRDFARVKSECGIEYPDYEAAFLEVEARDVILACATEVPDTYGGKTSARSALLTGFGFSVLTSLLPQDTLYVPVRKWQSAMLSGRSEEKRIKSRSRAKERALGLAREACYWGSHTGVADAVGIALYARQICLGVTDGR